MGFSHYQRLAWAQNQTTITQVNQVCPNPWCTRHTINIVAKALNPTPYPFSWKTGYSWPVSKFLESMGQLISKWQNHIKKRTLSYPFPIVLFVLLRMRFGFFVTFSSAAASVVSPRRRTSCDPSSRPRSPRSSRRWRSHWNWLKKQTIINKIV